MPDRVVVTGKRQRDAWIARVMPPVETVRPGLWSIPTPFPNNPLRYVLTYALEYRGGIALVDTGWPCEEAWDGLETGIAKAGWATADIKAVLVTHGHGDHVGLARRIRERTGAWIAIHEADASFPGRPETMRRAAVQGQQWLRRRGGDHSGDDPLRLDLPEMFDYELEPDRFLVDGDQPLGPGSDLVSLWTPGHTPGHTCFFHRTHEVLLTGDHILPRITPNISPRHDQDGDVLGDYLTSLAGLSELHTTEVLPAHEYRFDGLPERIRQLLLHHRERCAEILLVLAGQPACSTVDVAERLHWSRTWDQMMGLQRRLAIGETYAHLVHMDRSGAVQNRGGAVDSWHAVVEDLPTSLQLARPSRTFNGVATSRALPPEEY